MQNPQITEIEPIRWHEDHLVLLDQTRLPAEQVWIDVRDTDGAIEAIRSMRVRGAPAIGVAAAYAMALAARTIKAPHFPGFLDQLDEHAAKIAAARPTAINLGWAVQRALNLARICGSGMEAGKRLLLLAHEMREQDLATNRAIGQHGAPLIPSEGGVLTHCNTGALATAGYGTALGVIRAAWEAGKRPSVFCTETRPWLQGARLTAWELQQLGIPAKLVVDSATASLMVSGEIQAIVVGADRIAANGDVANKVGTYMLAVLARAHDIPFYVAAPSSSVDLGTASGADIEIEERPAIEVTHIQGVPIAPEGMAVRNPAFDVTPSGYISAIITEHGVLRAPFERALRSLASQAMNAQGVA